MNSVFTANEACIHSVQHLHNCLAITMALLKYASMLTPSAFLSYFYYHFSTWMVFREPRVCFVVAKAWFLSTCVSGPRPVAAYVHSRRSALRRLL